LLPIQAEWDICLSTISRSLGYHEVTSLPPPVEWQRHLGVCARARLLMMVTIVWEKKTELLGGW